MFFGDVKQLKPVFSFTYPFEKEVLKMFVSDESDRNIIQDYFSCAGDETVGVNDTVYKYRINNSMEVANNCTKFLLPYNPSKLKGDIWLKEHFRCRKAIVEIYLSDLP